MKLRRRLSRPRYLSSLAVRTSGLPYSRVQSSKVADFSACFGTFAPVLLGSTRARLESDFRGEIELLAGNAKKTLPRKRPQQKVKFRGNWAKQGPFPRATREPSPELTMPNWSSG